MNKKKRNTYIIAGIVVIVVIFTCVKIFGKKKGFQATFETSAVERGNISTSVTATGTVEPITQVEVGTQVSGIIDQLYVDYNSIVKKGQIIAELDKTNLESELSTALCNQNTAQTEYEYQLKNFNRSKELHDKELVSDYDYETAEYTYLKAKNDYEVAKNNVAKARTNLGYATIYSPIDGVVLSKSVESGQTVASSFSTPTLFIIANDLTRMQVIADVDEADIGGVLEGQRVTFTVDAYQGTIFEGEVTQVRQEAQENSNVVTYEVVINAPNPDLKLKPGLTASVTIYTNERNDVLLLPSKALSFTPTRNLIGKMDTIVDLDREVKHKVWIRKGKTFTAHEVEVGLTTGSWAELLSGDIQEGDRLVTNIISGQMPDKSNTKQDQDDDREQSPFMPQRPGAKRK